MVARRLNALGIALLLFAHAAAAQTDEGGPVRLEPTAPQSGALRDADLGDTDWRGAGSAEVRLEPTAPQSGALRDADLGDTDWRGAGSADALPPDEAGRNVLDPTTWRNTVVLDSDPTSTEAPGSNADEPSAVADRRRDGAEPLTPRDGVALESRPWNTPMPGFAPRAAFATKHASYLAAAWENLPGWREEAMLGAWSTFVQGCAALVRRAAWKETCERAAAERPASPAAARAFFEREFEAFQVRAADRAETGILTGYFEPRLEGSRVWTPRFRYPVYGVPDDLLYLDARLLNTRRPPVYVRIEGRNVVPVDDEAVAAHLAGSTNLYRLAVSRAPAALRDRKIRVRRSGDRIVAYFTRQEIEHRGLAAARPIAWVDEPDLLYSLHIEGSGRIRLRNGEILRVAYGEQNGHPFLPTVTVEPRPPVERVIDFFVSPAAAASRPLAEVRESPDLARPDDRPAVLVSSLSDPSYVFFRAIPNTDGGPPGAMGIPLTAGRSLAVDPRVTPLGAPVFIAARQSSGDATTRLMVAQDTGGAIHGALRADYFLGSSAAAGATALRMKDELRMWVLLPKSLAMASRLRDRSGAGTARADCLLADPEFCVE